MTALSDSLLLQALGWAVLNSLWQMALLWVVYLLLVSAFKNVKPHQKSALATLVLFSGFAWFAFTFISIILRVKPETHSLVSSSLIAVDGNEALNNWLQTMLPMASVLYLLLLVLPAINFVRNYRYVQLLRRKGISKAGVNWRMFVNRIAAQMGIRKPVHIWISEMISSPVTIGFFKPIILVPVAALNNLSTQQLEAVLLHELSHIRRFDYMLNIVITFIRTILYFNPFVKLIIRTIEREREKSCDEMVMQFQYDPHGYASALLLFQKASNSQRQMAIAANGGRSDLLHRIEKILGIEKKPILSFNRLAGMLAGLLCIIALNALIILGKPMVESKSFTFQQISNPLYLFLSGEKQDASREIVPMEEMIARTEVKAPQLIVDKKEMPVEIKVETEEELKVPSYFNQVAYNYDPLLAAQMQGLSSGLIHANYEIPVIPELKKYQEEQVVEAVEMARKVLQEKEWKEIEKNIADALTKKEKASLRRQYVKELNALNWQQIQTHLKLGYDKVNWEKVNDDLNAALVEIKLDSLHIAYTTMVTELNKAECMLSEHRVNAASVVPDSDITLQKIKDDKQRTILHLNRIKAARNKKVVHL